MTTIASILSIPLMIIITYRFIKIANDADHLVRKADGVLDSALGDLEKLEKNLISPFEQELGEDGVRKACELTKRAVSELDEGTKEGNKGVLVVLMENMFRAFSNTVKG